MLRITILTSCLLLLIASCVSKKEEGVAISDATLFELAKSNTSFFYYKNSLDTMNAVSPSSHFPFIRVRFNPRARSSMTDSLDGLEEAIFADESMVVKEIYNVKGGPLERYAIMYKLRGASNSASGWVWSELNADGTALFSASLKGSTCVSCHATSLNRDLVKTFDLH